MGEAMMRRVVNEEDCVGVHDWPMFSVYWDEIAERYTLRALGDFEVDPYFLRGLGDWQFIGRVMGWR
jgi:hypothetical protein